MKNKILSKIQIRVIYWGLNRMDKWCGGVGAGQAAHVMEASEWCVKGTQEENYRRGTIVDGAQ